MPSLAPGIHIFNLNKTVDGRDKPGHDYFTSGFEIE
jgi:hypothetical protein